MRTARPDAGVAGARRRRAGRSSCTAAAPTREEGLRVLGVLHRLGHDRAGDHLPQRPRRARRRDGRYHLGATEWEDVEAAVDHAVAAGAEDVVLVASSMGAALVLPVPAPVAAGGASLRRGAGRAAAGLERDPAGRRPAAGRVAAGRPRRPDDRAAASRIGIRLGRSRPRGPVPADFSTPFLIIHGTDDATVPFATSRTFALRRPDLVELVAVPGRGTRPRLEPRPRRLRARRRAASSAGASPRSA